jgi:hypothetical protein
MGTRDMLQRHVGGAFNFANMLSKAKDIYSATKPAVSMAKGLLPSGMARDALGAVGYGSTGAGSTGAGSTGAGSTGAGRMTRRMM